MPVAVCVAAVVLVAASRLDGLFPPGAWQLSARPCLAVILHAAAWRRWQSMLAWAEEGPVTYKRGGITKTHTCPGWRCTCMHLPKSRQGGRHWAYSPRLCQRCCVSQKAARPGLLRQSKVARGLDASANQMGAVGFAAALAQCEMAGLMAQSSKKGVAGGVSCQSHGRGQLTQSVCSEGDGRGRHERQGAASHISKSALRCDSRGRPPLNTTQGRPRARKRC
jgi:hypothetical protein